MSLEANLVALLAPLVNGRVYPDSTPDDPVFPLIVYQQVGGDAYAYLDKTLPANQNARVQVWVWSKTRMEASSIGRQVEAVLIAGPMPAEAYGALVADYQDLLKIYGTRQDFGLWFIG